MSISSEQVATPGYVATDVMGMAAAQQAMQSIYGDLNAAVQQLTSQQEQLAQIWTGEASSTFGIALSNFIGDFDKINNALVGMMEALGQNTHIYVNTADSSTQMAQAFTNSTGGMLTPASLTGAIQATGLSGF
jgi:WXG100 family type VII secretion target